jgi:Ca2+-transporting ATPase
MNDHLSNVSTPGPKKRGPGDNTPWHAHTADEVERTLETSHTRGLTESVAQERLSIFGSNEVAETKKRSILSIVWAQFQSLIVFLLLAAALVAFLFGDIPETVAIVVVVLLNATVGFFMEWRADVALTALRRESAATARVVRDGTERQIVASDLVPGDVLVLNAGDRTPADARITEIKELHVEEASLTGESTPVAKGSAFVDAESALADRTSMVYMGTVITEGRGRCIVTTTGVHTEMGKIGALIGEITEQRTPLERELHRLGNRLVGVVILLCAVIVGVGLLRGNDLVAMVEVGISLAIAAVPEGLPAVATMTLALGMQRMARMKALIRRLPAVETLGSTTVICCDKTGTLTKNEMTVRSLQLEDRRVEVSGVGYGPEGKFSVGGAAIDPGQDTLVFTALKIGALCCDAQLEERGTETMVLGDPTEGALLVAAKKAGINLAALALEYPRVGEVPFKSETKRMATLHRLPDGRGLVAVKGALSALLPASESQLTAGEPMTVSDQTREGIHQHNRALAEQGLRVLAVAFKEIPRWNDPYSLDEGLTFVGLVGMQDPLREEAVLAVHRCREAGIRVIMITGDQPATAQAIGAQLGLGRNQRGEPLKTVHGRELSSVGEEDWKELVKEVGVFARVSPEHKMRIVKGLQTNGDVVAMTGDGINDAPALKQADIGIAMGIKGTEVTKEAADMVIADDNFATIVSAVEQGRIIYGNILRFVRYLFSCNLSEILIVFTALIVGWPLPLNAIQILWLNVITDVFPALALVFESASPDMMKRPPRPPQEPILSGRLMGIIGAEALLICCATLLAFWVGLTREIDAPEVGTRYASSLAFMTLAFAQILHAYTSRSQTRSAFNAFFSNRWLGAAAILSLFLQSLSFYVPALQEAVHTVPIDSDGWLIVAVCGALPLLVIEIVKLLRRGIVLRGRVG